MYSKYIRFLKRVYKLRFLESKFIGFRHYFYRPNRKACLVFGLQKSGTTAISSLLASYTGLSISSDPRCTWEPYFSKLLSKELSIIEHINKKSAPFSKDIIKDPNLSFFINELHTIFDMQSYVLIIRNPFDNIRSILNALYLPGDASKIESKLIPYLWRPLFYSKNNNYIESLAKRWVEIYSKYELIKKKGCILVKYEDFNKNKGLFIKNLAISLNMEEKEDISNLLNKQFQRKGDRDVNLLDFFGEKNYKAINDICGDLMKHYGY